MNRRFATGGGLVRRGVHAVQRCRGFSVRECLGARTHEFRRALTGARNALFHRALLCFALRGNASGNLFFARLAVANATMVIAVGVVVEFVVGVAEHKINRRRAFGDGEFDDPPITLVAHAMIYVAVVRVVWKRRHASLCRRAVDPIVKADVNEALAIARHWRWGVAIVQHACSLTGANIADKVVHAILESRGVERRESRRGFLRANEIRGFGFERQEEMFFDFSFDLSYVSCHLSVNTSFSGHDDFGNLRRSHQWCRRRFVVYVLARTRDSARVDVSRRLTFFRRERRFIHQRIRL
mmetsp:Transcript_8637/g.32145  ORF Transcript_8637/g.32145 Transcript_8637/m.32145 type:complete len:297 (-) Transcript_8637:1574-2464(-)